MYFSWLLLPKMDDAANGKIVKVKVFHRIKLPENRMMPAAVDNKSIYFRL